MKKGMFILLLSFVMTLSFASNKTAIDYYDAGDLKKAKELFLATSNPDAMDMYFLGKIFAREGDATKATESFNKGLSLDPNNLYNSVGLAGLKLKSNQKDANKELKGISKNKLYKKNAHMQVEIAEVYARNGMKDLSNIYLALAKKADKQSPLPYIMEGNLLMEQGKGNDAAVQFENAIYFDPNSKIALVKLAQLYVGTRRQIAFEYLDKATAIDPNYEYGWKTQADLRREVGFYAEAREAFEKYLSLVSPTADDYQIYGQILYFAQDYDAALESLNKANENTVTTRLKMYSKFEQGKYDEAIALADKLIATTAKDKMIYQDYSNYSKMLSSKKDYAGAAKYLELAYEADPDRGASLSEIAKMYERAKDYDKAVEIYQKITNGNEYTLADVYSLGVTLYSAGTDKVTFPEEEKRFEYLKKASEHFAGMNEQFPDHYLGLFWQARCESQLDPETIEGLAKPYYEQVLPKLLETPDERKSEITEANIYLGVYYLKQDKYKEAKPYWEKVLELDPNNATAIQVLESLNSVN